MYTFHARPEKGNISFIVVRIVLAIVATVAFLQASRWGILAILTGLALLAFSYYIGKLAKKIPLPYILTGTILVLCILTQTIYFLLLILLYWLLHLFIKKETVITIDNEGILLVKPLNKARYSWRQVDFVILKDGLLTIQFINNRFFQREVVWENASYTENDCNIFFNSMVSQ